MVYIEGGEFEAELGWIGVSQMQGYIGSEGHIYYDELPEHLRPPKHGRIPAAPLLTKITQYIIQCISKSQDCDVVELEVIGGSVSQGVTIIKLKVKQKSLQV